MSRAHDEVLGRDVAIKELITRGPIEEVRFMREALITARLEHPGIVPVHEAGRWADGTPFYAMKLVSGRSLRALIGERKTVDDRLGLLHHVIAVADAIAYAHGRKIIHRDLKPANVIVGEFGETIVIDWGLAKDLSVVDDGGVGGGPFRAGRGRDDDLTQVGSVLGTPAYMPPEQERGEAVDQRADVFAIGAMLWELCTLKRLAKTRPQERYRELVRAGIDRDLAVIITKAAAPEAGERYRDAGALAADLKAFKAGARIAARSYSLAGMLAHWTRRNRRAAKAVVAALVCAAVGVVMYVRSVAVERDRADRALVTAQEERDRARLSEASLLMEKDPLRAKELLGALAMESPRYALLMSRAQERGAARVIPIEEGVQGLYRSPDGSEVVVVTKDGELIRVDPRTGSKQLLDRDVKQGIAYRDREWLYARKAPGEMGVWVSSPSKPHALNAGRSSGISMLASLDDGVYALDSGGDVVRLSEGEPVRLTSGARFIAGEGELLLVCGLDGTLEGFRRGRSVLRSGCLKNLSPEMMAVAANRYAVVRAPHVLTVSREGRTVDLPTEIVGEYEMAMSSEGVVVLADYARGGRPWFVREGTDELEPGPTYAASLFCVAAAGHVAVWGYRDGMVIALDTRTGAVWRLRGHPDAAFHMVVADDVLVTAGMYEVRVWELRQPATTQIGSIPCQAVTIRSSPDGAYAGIDCGGGTAWLWSRRSGQLALLHQHDKNSEGIQWLAGSAAGREQRSEERAGDRARMCSGGWDGRVLCSTVDGAATREFDTGGGRLVSLVASADHGFLGFASLDGRIWKLDDQLHELYSQGAVPSRVAISPSGRLIASTGLDGSLIVFDGVANREAARIAAHTGGVQGLGWLGDELWTSGADGTLRWWAMRSDGLELRAVVHESARLRLTKVFATGWATSVGDTVLLIHRNGVARPIRLELDKHIQAIDVSPDLRYVAAAVPGEIVVIDLQDDRLATLSIDAGTGVMFVDAATLAVNNAGPLNAVRVKELAYLPFVASPQVAGDAAVGPPAPARAASP